MEANNILSRIAHFPEYLPDLTDPEELTSLIETAALGALIGGGVGACATLLIAEITLLPAIMIGAAVLLTIFVAFWFFSPIIIKEDFNPLLTQSLPIGPDFIHLKRKLEAIFNQNVISFEKPSENYAIHHDITRWIDQLEKSGTQIQKETFKVFLRAINGRKAIYPDGRRIKLDFSREIRQLNGTSPKVKIELFIYGSKRYSKDLKEIVQIGEEGFTHEFGNKESFVNRFAKKDKRYTYVARDENNNNEIIGCIIVEPIKVVTEGNPPKEELYVATLARRANAASLGIGEKLFAPIMAPDFLSNTPLSLHVRASNQEAIKLYEKIGFVETGREQDYYANYPKEDALIMRYAPDEASDSESEEEEAS